MSKVVADGMAVAFALGDGDVARVFRDALERDDASDVAFFTLLGCRTMGKCFQKECRRFRVLVSKRRRTRIADIANHVLVLHLLLALNLWVDC